MRTRSNHADDSYYQHTLDMTLATRVGVYVRRNMFSLFMAKLKPCATTTVLDLGVTSEDENEAANYFEKLYPHPNKVTCAGTQDARNLEKKYPGISFVKITPHAPLPFPDHHFDIVFSNAVVEHAGETLQQIQFIAEALRVAKAFFITTPNRWFPIEMHTGLPFLHYLPKPLHRGLLRVLGFEFYAQEENLNLLGKANLIKLFPRNVELQVYKVRFLGVTSNLVAYGKSSV